MSEETAYAALGAELHGGVSVSSDGGPDLPGLFPSLEQDQEPFSSTDLPLPVSGEVEGPLLRPCPGLCRRLRLLPAYCAVEPS